MLQACPVRTHLFQPTISPNLLRRLNWNTLQQHKKDISLPTSTASQARKRSLCQAKQTTPSPQFEHKSPTNPPTAGGLLWPPLGWATPFCWFPPMGGRIGSCLLPISVEVQDPEAGGPCLWFRVPAGAGQRALGAVPAPQLLLPRGGHLWDRALYRPMCFWVPQHATQKAILRRELLLTPLLGSLLVCRGVGLLVNHSRCQNELPQREGPWLVDSIRPVCEL